LRNLQADAGITRKTGVSNLDAQRRFDAGDAGLASSSMRATGAYLACAIHFRGPGLANGLRNAGFASREQ
jgi:hypothetical protein